MEFFVVACVLVYICWLTWACVQQHREVRREKRDVEARKAAVKARSNSRVTAMPSSSRQIVPPRASVANEDIELQPMRAMPVGPEAV